MTVRHDESNCSGDLQQLNQDKHVAETLSSLMHVENMSRGQLAQWNDELPMKP